MGSLFQGSSTLSLMSALNFPRCSSPPFSHVLLLAPRGGISSSCCALKGGVGCPEDIPCPLSLLLAEPWALFSFPQVRSRCLTCLYAFLWFTSSLTADCCFLVRARGRFIPGWLGYFKARLLCICTSPCASISFCLA